MSGCAAGHHFTSTRPIFNRRRGDLGNDGRVRRTQLPHSFVNGVPASVGRRREKDPSEHNIECFKYNVAMATEEWPPTCSIWLYSA
jgi:hypothetical protein